MSACPGNARLIGGAAPQPHPVDPTEADYPATDDQGAAPAQNGLQLVNMVVTHGSRRTKRVRFAEGTEGLYERTLESACRLILTGLNRQAQALRHCTGSLVSSGPS